MPWILQYFPWYEAASVDRILEESALKRPKLDNSEGRLVRLAPGGTWECSRRKGLLEKSAVSPVL